MYTFENTDQSVNVTLTITIPKQEPTGFSLNPEEEQKFQLEHDMAVVKEWKSEMIKCLEKAEKDFSKELSGILQQQNLQASPSGHMLYAEKTRFNVYEFNMTREALSDLQQDYKYFLRCPAEIKETLKALDIYGFYARNIKKGEFTYYELLHVLFERL